MRSLRSTRWSVITGVGVLVALSWWAGCRQKPAESAPAAIKPWVNRTWAKFVGSESCRECHAAICDSYAAHPMAQAMCLASSEEETIENYSIGPEGFVTEDGRRYVVERVDGKVTHREQVLDRDGTTVIAEQQEPILLAMGSGTRGRSYMLVENGRLFESPISWYSSTSQWDLSPGYPVEEHNRFNREISGRCLLCHCGLPTETTGGGPDVFAYAEPYIREYGISCERCHGPAADHVTFHRTGAKQGLDPIVNPSNLDPVRRDDVCNQCHILGEDAVLRPGRNYDDFRPGDLLGDVWAIFVRGTDVDSQGRTQAVSHVQQTHSSVCFKESQGKLGCASCHDPHGVPADPVAHYRQACFKCHEGADSCSVPEATRLASHPDDSCVACHMPSIPANDIPHTSQTDHRILREPEKAAFQTMSEFGSLENWEIFGEEHLDWSSRERDYVLGLAWGDYAASSNDVIAAQKAIDLLKPQLDAFPQDARMRDILAYSHFLLGNRGEAVTLWEKAKELSPNLPTPHLSLGLLALETGSPGDARENFQRYIALRPRHVDIIYQLSRLESALLNPEEARRWCDEALRIDPGNPRLQQWSAELQAKEPSDAAQ